MECLLHQASMSLIIYNAKKKYIVIFIYEYFIKVITKYKNINV